MPHYIITYDLDEHSDSDYGNVDQILEQLGATRIQGSVWCVSAPKDFLREIYSTIRNNIAASDRLFVAELGKRLEVNSIVPSVEAGTLDFMPPI